MVCHDRRRRHRQATVQLAPLHSWHRRARRDRRDHRCRSHRRRHSHTRLSWYCSRCRQSGERRRREQRGLEGLQGRQRREGARQVGFECSNASDGRTLATGVADPFESRRCPADSGHVAFSPAPFRVGPRAVGRGRRFLLGPLSGVGTTVEWPPETKIRRQWFWRRTGVLLLLLAVGVMVAFTVRPGLLYFTSSYTRSATASPRSSIPSMGNKRVWVGRHP